MSCLNSLAFWRKASKGPIVSVIRLSGIIKASTGQLGMGSSLCVSSLEERLKRAFDVKDVKAVAVIVNSPGGSAVQSDLICRRITTLSKEKDVPVVSFCEDVAASGGYWLACSAEHVYANPASIIGSIGVLSASFGLEDAISKVGIKRRLYTAGTCKSMLDPFQPEKKDDVEKIKHVQRIIHKHFITHVKTSRGDRLKGTDDALFNGMFWTGQEALELGLIDGIGDIHSIMKEKLGKDVCFVNIGKKRHWLASLGRGEDCVNMNVGGSDVGENIGERLGVAMVDRCIDRTNEHLLLSKYGV
eukprot:CFRG5219T1